MPKNKNAYLRYLMIHSQIKRNKFKYGYPTLQDLAWYLEDEGLSVSMSTIEKDIRFLKYERRAPVDFDRKQMCYRYTSEWEFDVPLSPEDVRMLRMLIHKLELFGDAQEFRSVKDSIERLGNHFDLMHKHDDDRVNKYILFEYTKGFTGKHLLSPIYDAIYERRVITFTHCRFETDASTKRTIEPYTLKEHRNRWYIIGKENGEPRIFGLDRISDITVTDLHFIQEPDFYDEIFRVLKDAVGVMAFGFESQDVLLQFHKAESKYIKSLMLHRSQQVVKDDESGLLIKLHVKVTGEFIMECILRFGEFVRVISPDSLALKVKEIYKTALELYETD